MTKTEVKLIAFDIGFATGVTVDDFYRLMVGSEDSPIKSSNYQNHILADLYNDYIVGVLLCYKGDRKILATSANGQNLAVEKIKLKDNQSSTQASVFCINPSSLSGMFYSYHGGVSKANFGALLEKIHQKAWSEKVNEKVKELSNFGKNKGSFTRKAHDQYPGKFRINFKIRSHDINTLLNDFSQFNSIEMTVGPAIEQTSAFQPIINMSRSIRTTVSLDNTHTTEYKRDVIRQWWHNQKNKDLISKLKIVGKASFGTSLEESLGDNLEHFDRMYLDDYIDSLPDNNWSDYLDSNILTRLLEKVGEHSLVVPAPQPISTWKISLNKKDANSIVN